MTFYVFLNCRTRFLEHWWTRVADWESAKVSDRDSSTSRASQQARTHNKLSPR